MPTCNAHPHVELLSFCPACRGTVGGSTMSPAQVERNRKAAKLGGRPRGSKSAGHYRCSICRQSGHNRATHERAVAR